MKTIFIGMTINDGSVTEFFLNLANRLSKKYQVVIIADKIETQPVAVNPSIRVFQWPSERPTKFRDFIFLAKLIKKYRPTLMLSMFSSVNIFLVAGFIFRIKHRIAWARTISSAFILKSSLAKRKSLVYKLASRVFANSVSTKNDLIETFNVPSNKITVIPNAVRKPEFQTSVDDNLITFVGRMHPSKGIDTLLKAMPNVVTKFPKIRLQIIGGGDQQPFVELAEKLQVSNNVVFRGRQTKDVLLRELSRSYFSLVPSVVEAFGFVIIESFSVCTPVIGSNSSGIAEVIRHGQDGFLFETGNSDDLAEKMLHLLADKELRDKFGQNCHCRFAEEYEIDNVAEVVSKKISLLINA